MLVEHAAQDKPQAKAQLSSVLKQMSEDSDVQPERRVLVKVLASVLSGDRQPNLDELPDGLASLVRNLLERLGE